MDLLLTDCLWLCREAWGPNWQANAFAEYQIYQNRSIELVMSKHPGFGLAEATAVAKVEFETAAQALFLETLGLAKAMRPKGRWVNSQATVLMLGFRNHEQAPLCL